MIEPPVSESAPGNDAAPAPLPHGVGALAELALRVNLGRLPAVVLAALPMLVFVWLPSAAGSWLGIQWARTAFEQGVFEQTFTSLEGLENYQQFLYGNLPATGPMKLAQALNSIALLGGIVCGPLLYGALVLLVVGGASGVRLGAQSAWRGALRRGFQLVVTETVKAVILLVVFIFSIFIAVIVVAVVAAILDGLVGDVGGPALVLLEIFGAIFFGGLIAFGPAVYLFLLWIFTVPLVLFERKDVVSALRQSAAMVRAPAASGHWHSHAMRLTGLLTLVGLALLLAGLSAAAPWMVWAQRAFRRAMEGDFGLFLAIPGGVFLASVVLWTGIRLMLAALFPGAVGLYYAEFRQAEGPTERAPAELGRYVRALCAGQGPLPEALPGIGNESRPVARPQALAPPPPVRPSSRLPPSWPDG